MGISERVSESLIAELDRLEAIDVKDAETMQAELSRAKAVQGIACQLIANGNMTLNACRMRMEFGDVAKVPKGLVG